MKLFAIALLVLTVPFVFAQNAPLPTQTWSVTYSEVDLPGGHQTFAGSEAGIGLRVTSNLSILQENLLAPGSPNFGGYFGGGLAYDFPAISTLLNNVSPTLSGFRFKVGLLGSFGRDLNNFGSVTKQNWAGSGRVRIGYSLDSGNTWQTGLEVGVVRLPNFSPGFKPVISAGFAKLW